MESIPSISNIVDADISRYFRQQYPSNGIKTPVKFSSTNIKECIGLDEDEEDNRSFKMMYIRSNRAAAYNVYEL